MEMHQIRYFLAVSQSLSFTRAAEECHVAQPSLSRAIKLLEEELGGELLRRERNLSHLTDLGRSILPTLRQCYESCIAAKSLAKSYGKDERVSLNLALSRTIELGALATCLSEINAAFPRVEINLCRGAPREIAEKLKKGEAEIAVSAPLGEDWERFDSWPLFKEKFGLVLSLRHKNSNGGRLSLQEIANERLICRPNCGIADRLFAQLKKHAGIELQRHEAPTVADIVELARANLGIGLLPLATPLADGVCFATVEDMDLNREIRVVVVAGRQRTTPSTTLVRLLRAMDWTNKSRGTNGGG